MYRSEVYIKLYPSSEDNPPPTTTTSTNPAYTPLKKYKVMILGDSTTGKSALVTRYSAGKWPLPWIPAVNPEPVSIETETTLLELWDTSGRKEYDNIRYSGRSF